MMCIWQRTAVAAVLALAMVLQLDAEQAYNAVRSGGPLWWLPANDGSYSRHHDFWYESAVEALNNDWGAATSFPTNLRDTVWVSRISGAPPNSACDLNDEREINNVGPFYPEDNVTVGRVPDRTPPGGGGFAGLQMSMHVGEWWQGQKYGGYWVDAAARAAHFASRPGFNPSVFGWFDVTMLDGVSSIPQRPPLFGGTSVDWIDPGREQWQLHGGGGLRHAMPRRLYGADARDGERRPGNVWPDLPRGADGGECWSSARPFILRVNTEARCEPDLRVRPESYDPAPFTEEFYAIFDAAPPQQAPAWIGGSYRPLFPNGYRSGNIMMRRADIAVFAASDLADSGRESLPGGWSPPSYAGHDNARRARFEDRFLAADRPDPFGGTQYGSSVLDLYISDLDTTECVEMQESGSNAATGTLTIDCEPARENSRYTGIVNRAAMSGETRERTLEVGAVDNSAPVGAGPSVPRRTLTAPFGAPSGYRWFQHDSASLGCLFLRATDNGESLVSAAESARMAMLREVADWHRVYLAAAAALGRCRTEICRAQQRALMLAAQAAGTRAFRESYGWQIVRDYRRSTSRRMRSALASARPYSYELGGAARLTATSRTLRGGGNACVTGLGGGSYNEALIPSYPTFEASGGGTDWAPNSSIPGQGGRMWYGDVFDGYRPAHHPDEPLEDREHYTQFADVAGRTTARSERAINPGSSYPEELRRYADYNRVRLGSAVWREFACKTVHSGLYGMGVEAMGSSRLGHREAPGDAWRARDPRIELGNPARSYPSGTPCVGDPRYDVPGCYDPDDGLGAYSESAHPSGRAGSFVLTYSGDGAGDGTSGPEHIMRPTPYRMIAGSELFDLTLHASIGVRAGFPSLDVERASIWSGFGASTPGWLRTGEAYQGVPPGWAGCDGCDSTDAPMDWGRLEHQGQVRWYGAMVVGGTGGCTLLVNGRALDRSIQPQGAVMATGQTVMCLLPTTATIRGACPGESLR